MKYTIEIETKFEIGQTVFVFENYRQKLHEVVISQIELRTIGTSQSDWHNGETHRYIADNNQTYSEKDVFKSPVDFLASVMQ